MRIFKLEYSYSTEMFFYFVEILTGIREFVNVYSE